MRFEDKQHYILQYIIFKLGLKGEGMVQKNMYKVANLCFLSLV